MTKLILWTMILLLLAACGNSSQKHRVEEKLSRSEALLNSQNYEAALQILKPLYAENPQHPEVRTKLLHATAGAGGFEALKLIEVAQEVEKQMKKFQTFLDQVNRSTESTSIEPHRDGSRSQSKPSLPTVRASSKEPDDMLAEFEKVLAPIPVLSPLQLQRLDEALGLYQEFGLATEEAESYVNFKWGALHIFRMAVNLKLTIRAIKVIAPPGRSVDLGKLELILIPGLGNFGQDLFMSYKLFGHSFDRIKIYSRTIDKVIASLIRNQKFRLKVNTRARSQGEFYSSLVRDNLSGVDVVIRKILEVYVKHRQTQESQRKIEALVRVSLRNLFTRRRDVNTGLENIFSSELRVRFLRALEESRAAGNFNPLRNFFTGNETDIQTLVSYFKIIVGELALTDLPNELRLEVEKLAQALEREKPQLTVSHSE